MHFGLDLMDAEHSTKEELDGYRHYDVVRLGEVLPSHEFLFEFMPDQFKRFRLQVHLSGMDICESLAMLHIYAIMGFEKGIWYMTRYCQLAGASRNQVLETLAIATLHTGAFGLSRIANTIDDDIRDYDASQHAQRVRRFHREYDGAGGRDAEFPPGWESDPTVLESGLDASTAELTARDRERLDAWYLCVCGEVPAFVPWLAALNPRWLKAWRLRFEGSLGGALPNQMLPYLLIHYNVARGFGEGIREAALLGRGLGMTNEQIVHAVLWGSIYDGGPASVSICASAIGDVLGAGD
jgi:alkylhydroperoxidase/carboxymuconolactone decarboxylase family protein YurZ